jgi:hypothetical protein
MDSLELTNTSDLVTLFNNITKNLIDVSLDENNSSSDSIFNFNNLTRRFKSLTNISITNHLLRPSYFNNTLTVH